MMNRMEWAWTATAHHSSAARLVLLALTMRANSKSLECWPSMSRLAADANTSINTVKKGLRELSAAGLLDIIPRPSTDGGREKSHLYRLRVGDQNLMGSNFDGINSGPPTPSNFDGIPGQNLPPNPRKKEPKEGTQGSVSHAKPDPFPCPVNVDEGTWRDFVAVNRKKHPLTETAYKAIVKKLDGWASEGLSPADIVEATVENGWRTVWLPNELQHEGGTRNGSRKGNSASLALWRHIDEQARADREDRR